MDIKITYTLGGEMADLIYFNGDIVTVDENNSRPEAIAVKEGKIYKVGTKEEVMQHKTEETVLVDLESKTLLPGFIDPHSHMIPTSQVAMMPDLSPAPIGDVTCIDDIINKLKKMIEEYKIPAGGIIMAKGYDETLLKEGRTPTKFDLDKVSTEHNIYILHCSLHVAVCNSRVLDQIGIDENTEDPEGGVIQRVKGSREPNGVLEENAHIKLGSQIMPPPKPEAIAKMFIDGQDDYASKGITTVQDGGLNQMYFGLLKSMSDAGVLKLDVVGYQLVHSGEDVESVMGYVHNLGKYVNNYKTGGIKVLLDGSPQAKTAWLSKPYHIAPEEHGDDYRGYPSFPDNEVCVGIFEKVLENKAQVLVHANGDQASEQFLDCYEEALKRTKVKDDLRPVMIHAQTVREDQLDRMKEIRMMPSFFSMHTYFWGDLHINSSLGKERAYRISPAASAVKRDMKFTMHADTPVLPSDMLLNIWAAVNRVTRTGEVIGPDQRISVLDAIKGITINAAYQYSEEDSKGSIEVGKRADLVILDNNPLDVKKLEIKNIKVLETIKDGVSIYKRD